VSTKLQDALAYAPRGLRAERAAAYVGMGKTKFLELVDSGQMPVPVEIDGVKVWDRLDLDSAFDTFKDKPKQRNSFDVILGTKK
jgi:predicted DNA-binding transcriptional regulator AlpA